MNIFSVQNIWQKIWMTSVYALVIATILLSFPLGGRGAGEYVFTSNTVYLTQGQAISLSSENSGESASYNIVASLSTPTGGQVNQVVVEGVTITAGEAPVQVIAGYDFGIHGGVLTVDVTPVAGKYGIANLTFDLAGTGTGFQSIEIDTRISETGNIVSGQRYGKDAYGGLLDFDAPGAGKVAVTNTHVTGLIWSESFGWIDLQPPGGGVTHTSDGTNEALDGFAWNDDLGWIDFGQIDGSGGVYIDSAGYFQGTAWSENFGYLSFGDSMALDPTPDSLPTTVIDSTQWAKTSWSAGNSSAPTIVQVDPVDLTNFSSRTPTFSFHIEDADSWNKVGYTINVNKKNALNQWDSYKFETHLANLSVNATGENYTHTFATDFVPGQYQWEMWAYDEGGLWSETTGFLEFTILNGAPTVSLDSPADASTITFGNRRPQVSFTITEPDGDKIQYRVEFSEESDFSTILQQSSPLSGYLDAGSYSYTPSTNLPAGTIYWRVVVTDVFGASVATPVEYSFVIQNELPTISNISLRDNANAIIPNAGVTYDTTPTIQWESQDNDGVTMDTYIEVYEDPGVGSRDPSVDTLATVNSVPASLSFPHNAGLQERDIGPFAAGDYYYRIRTKDSDDDYSAWAIDPYQSFTVEARTEFGNVGTANIKGLYPNSMMDDSHDVPLSATPGAGYTDVDSSNNRSVWNKTVGWIDMNPVGGGVVVKNKKLQGYAWSDTLGWIRMNSEAFDTNIGITDSGGNPIGADAITYGVSNNDGNLTGKALIESTGNFLYFDEQSYIDDFPAAGPIGTNSEINVDILCDDNYKGHFTGWGYAPDTGWIAFGRQALIDSGYTANEAADYFSMTEWSCPIASGPVLESNNVYTLFAAQNTEDKSFSIAHKNTEAFSGDLVCSSNDGSQGTEVNIQKMNADGTVDTGVSFSDGVDFSVGCTNKNGDIDGRIWLTIDKSSTLLRTPGLYRIVGDVGDGNGETTAFPEHTPDEGHNFVADSENPGANSNDEYIIQIVAGVPDMSHANTIEYTKLDSIGIYGENSDGRSQNDPLIADGDDTMRLNFTLYDVFGNIVKKEYKYENNTYESLKTPEMRVIFWDEVLLDQVENNGISGEAVTISGAALDGGAPFSNDGIHHSVEFVNGSVVPTVLTEVSSIAPSNTYNYQVKIAQIEATVTQDIDSLDFSDVGQTDALANGKKVYIPAEPVITFSPIIAANLVNFDVFAGQVVNTTATFSVVLTNESDQVDIDTYDWMGIARSRMPGSLQGLRTYESTTLESTTPSFTTAINDHWQEIASVAAAGTFTGGITAGQFPLTLDGKINTGTDEIKVFENKFPPLAAGDTYDFFFHAIPKNEPGDDEMAEFLHYFAFQLAGAQAGKTIKFPLQTASSSDLGTSIKLSIAGSTHGDEFDESILVSEGVTDEYSSVGQIYDRQEIRKIMYENYRSITGLRQPKPLIPDANLNEVKALSTWTDLNTERNTTPIAEQYRSLLNGKVVWYERDDTHGSLTIDLGDDTENPFDTPFIIPPDQGPITLIVRGGNIYIRDNIFVGKGSNLGIVVLSSRKNSSTGTEGNIFIDPSVTHLEGVFYADGSLLSADDIDESNPETPPLVPDGIITENEIFDGFSVPLVEEKFSNQLFIKGSIVSQNTAGTLSKVHGVVVLPNEIWLPEECPTLDGSAETCNESAEQEKAAKRYDLEFMRRFMLRNVFDDTDDDGIKDSADCDQTPPASISYGACVDTAGDGNYYNSSCETAYHTPKSQDDMPEGCKRSVTKKISPDAGHCAVGTPWCTDKENDSPFTLTGCGDISALCTSDGVLDNPKMGAAVIVEFDPKVKKITPVGMNLPPVVNFQ